MTRKGAARMHLTPTTGHPMSVSISTKNKSRKKNPKWNLTAHTFPALVFSLVPNSFVYSDMRLQLARRWKSILQHLACVLHFADELCLLAAFCCPRKEELLMGANSPKAHRLTRENQSVSLVYNWLHRYLFVFVLFSKNKK